VLAFRRGIRNFVYPVRQFDRQRPIERLRKGKVEEVVRAAEGALDFQ